MLIKLTIDSETREIKLGLFSKKIKINGLVVKFKKCGQGVLISGLVEMNADGTTNLGQTHYPEILVKKGEVKDLYFPVTDSSINIKIEIIKN